MNAPSHHDSSERPQDVQLRQMLHRLPEPAPSHGFDARLVDALMQERPISGHSAESGSGAHAPPVGISGWVPGLRRPSWQLVATASLGLAIATAVIIQQWPSDNDLTRIDLITLMSHDLL